MVTAGPGRESTPDGIYTACDDVIRAYLHGRTPVVDPVALVPDAAARYAEMVALQSLQLLTSRVEYVTDLTFAQLFDAEAFTDLAPAMRRLVRFLRARLVGHEPHLRLPPEIRRGTPSLALALLLVAAHALTMTGPDPEDALHRVYEGLRTGPASAFAGTGDLAHALPPAAAATATEAVAVADEVRALFSEAVPITSSYLTEQGQALLVLDLAARPDVADLFRIQEIDPSPEGADTWSKWSGLVAGGVVRLDIEWIEPVRVGLALVLTLAEHADILEVLAHSYQLVLTATDPATLGEGARWTTTSVPLNPGTLTGILAKV